MEGSIAQAVEILTGKERNLNIHGKGQRFNG
jgi:hypothetical protein